MRTIRLILDYCSPTGATGEIELRIRWSPIDSEITDAWINIDHTPGTPKVLTPIGTSDAWALLGGKNAASEAVLLEAYTESAWAA